LDCEGPCRILPTLACLSVRYDNLKVPVSGGQGFIGSKLILKALNGDSG